jgi:hypothetical protein
MDAEEWAAQHVAQRRADWERQFAETKAEVERRIAAGGNVRYWRRKLDELVEVETLNREWSKRGGMAAIPKLRPQRTARTAGTARVAVTAPFLDRGHVRTCTCGRRFTGVRADARYCSSACRQRAYRERQGRTR